MTTYSVCCIPDIDKIPQEPGIYILDFGGSVYVGQSLRLRSRIRDHYNLAFRSRHHNKHVQQAFDDADCILSVKVIVPFPAKEKEALRPYLNGEEIATIRKLRQRGGKEVLNIKAGGSGDQPKKPRGAPDPKAVKAKRLSDLVRKQASDRLKNPHKHPQLCESITEYYPYNLFPLTNDNLLQICTVDPFNAEKHGTWKKLTNLKAYCEAVGLHPVEVFKRVEAIRSISMQPCHAIFCFLLVQREIQRAVNGEARVQGKTFGKVCKANPVYKTSSHVVY